MEIDQNTLTIGSITNLTIIITIVLTIIDQITVMMGVIQIEITKAIISTTIISTILKFKIVLQLSQSKTIAAAINIITLQIRIEIQATKITTPTLRGTLQEVVIITIIISIFHSISKELQTGKLGDQDQIKILFQIVITFNGETTPKTILNVKVVTLKKHNNNQRKISKTND